MIFVRTDNSAPGRPNPTALVVVVDAAAVDGGPAALLEVVPGATALEQLLVTVAGFGVHPTVVLTRTGWHDQVSRVLPAAIPVVGYSDVGAALGQLAVHLDGLGEPVLLAHGDVVLHGGAVGDLVADPRLGTAVLSHQHGPANLRVTAGAVRGAGSAEHPLPGADRAHGGLMRIDPADRTALVLAARYLSGIATVSGWVADPIELLTLGALQRGVEVREVVVGEYVFGRPVDPGAAWALGRALTENDEHRIRLRRVARPDDGFYSTFVVRKLSPKVTDLAVRRGWTPNQITLGALGIALLAAAFFALGNRVGLVVGALLLQVSLVVDCVDGETARYARTFSALGAWLDATTDRVKEFTVYAALAYGSARCGREVWGVACATLALQVFRNFVDFGFVATLGQRDGSGTDSAAAALGRGAVSLSARTSATAALKWAKRMVFLPIGERWLLISVFAAFSGAHAVFLVLLTLGAVSACYATAGRVLRTVAAGPVNLDPAVSGRDGELDQMIDASPQGRALAGRLPRLPVEVALGAALVAALVTAVLASTGRGWLVALGLFAVALLAAPAWREPPTGRFGWLMPGVVRGLEYGLVVRVVAALDHPALPAAFALLCVVTYHHYDTVYRWRHTRQGPRAWVFRVGLGWDGRLFVLGLVLLGTRRLGPLLGIGAVVLAVAFLVESAGAWTTWVRAQREPVTRSA
jgi:phosphatidylglycerophosphate synthase